jgi:DNA-binding SARP family transcriptional activator
LEDTVEFRVLGPLEVVERDRPLELGGPRQRALLAYLLVHANEVIPTERLIEDLWGSAGSGARPLQVAVSRLRSAIEADDRLLTRPGGYLLRVAPDECDRELFECRFGEGRRSLDVGHADEAADTLRRALALWRGPPFADFLYEPFAQAEIARLDELRLSCEETRIEAELTLGRHADLVSELEALIREHPLRERPRLQLMLALYRTGRHADALDVYQATRSHLVDELGIEPSSQLRDLQQAILRQDPELDLASVAVTAAEKGVDKTTEPHRAVSLPNIRKIVTVLVAGPGDSAAPRRLDPELRRRLGDRVLQQVAPVAVRNGATVERLSSDRAMAVFGVPAAHEDDALRAVKTAAELLANQAAGLQIGIDTGVVLTGDASVGDPLVTGDALDSAAFLQRSSRPGAVVIGDATRQLVRDAVTVDGVELAAEPGGEPETAWVLLELHAGAPAFERRFDAPLIGRGADLAQLRQAFERTTRERRAHLVTVFGEAGVGKTRLVHELIRSVADEAQALTGRCLSYGEAITYWPLREIVEQAAGGRDIRELLAESVEAEAVAERLETAIGSGTGAAVKEEVFWAVRKLAESLAREAPLLIVFEDVHWAEPTLLDLIEYVADWIREAPVLVACLARPELLDERPAWGGGKLNATSILLEPLSQETSSELIGALPAGAELRPEARSRIARAAGGNPLFLEQMLAMLAQGDDADAEIAVPPAIQALLAARLDRLEPDERLVLERAAVEGEAFHLSAVVELTPDDRREAVPACLMSLVRKELIRPDAPGLPGDDAFRFRHALIRDAAYERLSKERRSRLHELYADWLEQTTGERADEFDEFLGYHLEQAYRYRSELGPLEAEVSELAGRARLRLVSAGRLAFRRGDIEAAVNLLERARSVSSSDERAWLGFAPDVGFALFHAGEFERARRILDDAIDRSSVVGDCLVERHAWVVRDYSRLFHEPDQIELAHALRQAEESIKLFQAAHEDAALSRAWNFVWHLYQSSSEPQPIREIAERSLAHAKRAGSPIDEAWSLALLVYSLLEGPTPAGEAVLACERLLEELSASRLGQATVNTHLAPLLAMQGRFEEARSMIVRGRADLEEFRMEGPQLSAHELASARVERLAADPVATERATRAAAAHSGETADSWYHAVALIDVAHAVCDLDQPTECLRLLDESETFAAPPDVELVVKRPAFRALALAQLGCLDEARTLAGEAVANAAGREYLNYEAEALLVQAEVLRLSGDFVGARRTLEDALGVLERKGNTVLVARTRTALEALAD